MQGNQGVALRPTKGRLSRAGCRNPDVKVAGSEKNIWILHSGRAM
jgi:hypothetical protein